MEQFIKDVKEKHVSDLDKNALKHSVDNMTDTEILNALRELDPLGKVVNGDDTNEVASFAITDLRHEYHDHLTTTAMIGYLFQRASIYKIPEDVKPVSIGQYLKEGDKCMDPPAYITDEKIIEHYAMAKASIYERMIIYKFLTSVFDYNPDEHVRSAYYPVKDSVSRKLVHSAAAKLAVANKNTIRGSWKPEYYPDPTDIKIDPTNMDPTDIKSVGDAVEKHIPSIDVFQSYNTYKADHYEEFQKLVWKLYGLSKDIDTAVNIFGVHKTNEEALKFKDDNIEKLNVGINQMPVGQWGLIGPYAKNIENIEHFSREKHILTSMLDKIKEDQVIADDIVKKKIVKRKKKEIKEQGPDSKAFKAWAKQNNNNATLGGEHVDADDYKITEPIKDDGIDDAIDKVSSGVVEKTKKEFASKSVGSTSKSSEFIKDDKDVVITKCGKTTVVTEKDDECPADAVELGVTVISGGGTNITQDKMYTKAEAPTKA